LSRFWRSGLVPLNDRCIQKGRDKRIKVLGIEKTPSPPPHVGKNSQIIPLGKGEKKSGNWAKKEE
jgi:hypothetical protein